MVLKSTLVPGMLSEINKCIILNFISFFFSITLDRGSKERINLVINLIFIVVLGDLESSQLKFNLDTGGFKSSQL